jgi:UDP-N-acetylglucosamine transferase subunit ALG13
MVFATIGTQKQRFDRFLDIILKSKELQNENIVAQMGGNNYDKINDRIEIKSFISSDEFEKYMNESDFVICHGGVGTIFTALEKGKKVIVIPRLKKYGEHINDHQVDICKQLQDEGYIVYLSDGEDIDDKINILKKGKLKKYENKLDFLDILKKEI